jgi:hypothetical protein
MDPLHERTRRVIRGLLIAALAVALAACGGEDRAAAPPPEPVRERPVATPRPEPPPQWPVPDRYEPDPAEGYPNGKRLAANIAAAALTYPRGASARDVARRLTSSSSLRRELADAIEPAVDRSSSSEGQVVYPQLSGVTETSLGAMVVARQRLLAADGSERTVLRVVDVRLRRDGGPWRLAEIGSVGGRPVPRPRDLSEEARRVLDDPRITLSDSARWDIYRGGVDDGLLSALADAAERYRISVSVLSSGHPREVWQTSRPSAHSRGFAADIYAVGGRLVIRQQEAGTPAYALTASFVGAGAAQVGSPWVLGPGGSRSFSDDVHADHIHVQWSPMA